ncbi:Signal peptidase I [Desulfovibrionales bacterium]
MTPRWQKMLKEYIEAMIIAFVLATFIRTFFVQAFKIPSGSMLETLQIGDHLLVNKIVYGIKMPMTEKFLWRFTEPQYEDIIVFEYPLDQNKDFIKRIVGLPGDTIEIRNKDLYRNGQKVSELYTQHTDPRIIAGPRDNKAPITVPQDKFFVMGDNRDESHDSRFWGFVDRGKIKGRAWILYWSWQGFNFISWNRIGHFVH